jgi:beta-lactamase class A
LSTGRELGVAPDMRVPTASTIKLPMLCALESLVAAGKVKWDERIVLKREDAREPQGAR